jgi:hypothetical protein
MTDDSATVAATIRKITTLHTQITTLDPDHPIHGIERAGLQGLLADVIAELYAFAGNPEALPAAQVRFVRRQFTRSVSDRLRQLPADKDGKVHLAEVLTALLVEANQ